MPGFRVWCVMGVLVGLANVIRGDDWPQWLGPKRDGVYREKGILKKFPAAGLKIEWRRPIHTGFSGPSVAEGRLYVMDREADVPLHPNPAARQGDAKGGKPKPAPRAFMRFAGRERVLCLDARSGQTVWEHVYDCPYQISYPNGPRTTPLVANERVYTLGAMGRLICFAALTGKILWSRELLRDYQLKEAPVWGYAAHPLLDGRQLICLVGGPGSAVVSFDADTGKELWRALTAEEIGYSPPVIHEIHGRRHLIIWHPDALTGLDPVTGTILWEQKYPPVGAPQRPEVTIALPRLAADRIFVSSFYQGALLLQVNQPGRVPTILWHKKSVNNSRVTEGLHAINCTPFIQDEHLYGVCGMGELRCLRLADGSQAWESLAGVGGKRGLSANAFLIPHEDRCFLWNDRGDLILAKLSPAGYQEISRMHLLAPTFNARGRTVVWSHPAFADRAVFVRNDKEILRASLAE